MDMGSYFALHSPTAYPTEPTATLEGGDTTQAVKGNTKAGAANVNVDTTVLHWGAGIIVVALICLWLLGGIVFRGGAS